MRTPAMLMSLSLSARPNDPSLIRFAPKVFVSSTSAPARTYSRCTSSTRSGCVRFIASKLLLMNTPREYSIVPMAPSHTRTRSFRASAKGFIRTLCVQSFTAQRVLIDEQVRFRHQIEPDRANALPHRISEFVVMPEQMQAGMHRRQHLVDHRLARIDAFAGRMKR